MLNYITPDEAVRAVKSGDYIHISRAAQLPYCLLEALERRADAGITDSHFHHSYSDRLHYVMTTNLTAKTKLCHQPYMFNLFKFISTAVTYRPASMFEPDIRAHRDALTREIRGRKVCVIGGAGSIGSSFIRV